MKMLLLIILSSTSLFAAKSGKDIASDLYYRDQGNDYCAEMEMEILLDDGSKKERALDIKMKKVGKTDRILMRVKKPTTLKGTSFLSWNHPDKDNEQWIYLSSLKRVRRISSSGRNKGFVGSDFSYQDLSKLSLEKYIYKNLGRKKLGNRECYLLEITPKDKKEKIQKRLAWIDVEKNLVLKAEMYGKRGKKRKEMQVGSTALVEGIWTIMSSTMTNFRDESKTKIALKSIDYNCGVKKRQVSKSGLR